jgi:hypothetical protein
MCEIVLLNIILSYNNKLSRLDACPSATREGKNFNTHFWAAYGTNRSSTLVIRGHVGVPYSYIIPSVLPAC